MTIFEYQDYKSYVRDWVAARPSQGRGEYRRMALHLRISSTMISQVFNGEKDLNLEMAAELGEFFGLGPKEERFFFLLIEFNRAGSHRLKTKLKEQIREEQDKAKKLSEHMSKDKELNAEDRALFYSTWVYAGIRNLVAIDKAWPTPEIADRLKIPEVQVTEALKFLTDHGLLRLKNGHYEVLAKTTHLGADNPLVIKHHQNWRIRGFQKMDLRNPDHLFYTGPMSLSFKDCDKIRAMFVEFLASINKVVRDSPSETVRCVNIDWFEY